jgi:hypothetical protein
MYTHTPTDSHLKFDHRFIIANVYYTMRTLSKHTHRMNSFPLEISPFEISAPPTHYTLPDSALKTASTASQK